MTDARPILADLRRPRILMRAARHGLADYRRDRDLKRLIDGGAAAGSRRAAADVARKSGWRRPVAPAMPPIR